MNRTEVGKQKNDRTEAHERFGPFGIHPNQDSGVVYGTSGDFAASTVEAVTLGQRPDATLYPMHAARSGYSALNRDS